MAWGCYPSSCGTLGAEAQPDWALCHETPAKPSSSLLMLRAARCPYHLVQLQPRLPEANITAVWAALVARGFEAGNAFTWLP